jgi:hypothetical protein
MLLELWCILLKGQVLVYLYRLTSMPGIPYGATFKQPARACCFRCDAYGQYPHTHGDRPPIPAKDLGVHARLLFASGLHTTSKPTFLSKISPLTPVPLK